MDIPYAAWLIFSCFLFLSHGVLELEASIEPNQPYRTSYHFQPSKNWMNDPNGPMIYKGVYHLFYQYNPSSAIWGNIVWGHSTSIDLVNWTPHDPAINPSQPSDINGCWSGSTTILPSGTPVILYTGIDLQNRQVQNLAIPKNLSDTFLKEWIKSGKNPLMEPTASNQISANSFRDPSTAWLGPDGSWRVIIGSHSDLDNSGLAILYRSTDFINWIQSDHPLYSANGTGMWECPDFFPVSINTKLGVDTSIVGPDVKHVLKLSFAGSNDYYAIGSYSLDQDIYVPDKGQIDSNSWLRYDYGKFYASKSFFDSAKKRRILWGWISESSNETDNIKKGWAGIQAVPRTLWLDVSGKLLVQWPIREIEKLRKNEVHLPKQVLQGGVALEVSGVTAAQADVEISFSITELEKAELLDPSWSNPQTLCSERGASVKGSLGPFGLLALASKGLEEYTAVFYRIFKGQDNYVVLMCSDQNRSSLNNHNDKITYGTFVDLDPVREKLSLRSLIDRSIVESFGGEGKACITARVYPTLAIDDKAHLHVFNNGTENVNITSLSAWSMNKAQIN